VVKTQDSLLDFVHWESATRQRDLHPRHLRQPVDTRWFRGPGRDSVRHGHRVSLCLKSHRMPPAARCRQAFSAPTECSLARQVILPCPFLDRFPAGSEGPPPPASHDPGSPKSQASGPTDQPKDDREKPGCCPPERDRVIVTAMDAATD